MNTGRSCIECKGRYCNNYKDCPLFYKAQKLVQHRSALLKADLSTQAPAPFVGHFGYPNVRVGILAPPEKVKDIERYDAPRQWASENMRIPEIVGYRSSLINSRFISPVKGSSRLLDVTREVGMASRPVDIELKLKKAPLLSLSYDTATAPLGPSARVMRADLSSNPHVTSAVEKVVEDTDMKAAQALAYLADKGYDENFLMRLMSVGNVGVERKLVPTRWSITATDDILGKRAIDTVKMSSSFHGYAAYFGSYLGNYYLLLFFPEPWSYELFETFATGGRWSTDYESTLGRKTYAEATAGGYYSVRLAIAEHLRALKRNGAVLALRFITAEYTAPLGVWVTREAARKALGAQPVEFSSKELMLRYAFAKIQKQFGYDITAMISASKLLKEMSGQKRLGSYL